VAGIKELPKYGCHKVVGALKIREIRERMIIPEERDFVPFEVSEAYLAKHQPQPGGYYVVYEGGYESFSPAAVFEAGYSKMGW